MRRLAFISWLGLLASPAWAQQTQAPAPAEAQLNQPPKLTVENIQQKTEILRDPTVAIDNAQRELGGQADSAKPVESAAPNPLRDDIPLSDPTQMTGSFSQALGRVSAKPGQASVGGSAPVAQLPDISLVARAIRRQDTGSVMLNVAGKTQMVRQGSRFSILQNGQLYEIRVDRIESDQVGITLLPSGKQMILQ